MAKSDLKRGNLPFPVYYDPKNMVVGYHRRRINEFQKPYSLLYPGVQCHNCISRFIQIA
jgi:hypothetical protein